MTRKHFVAIAENIASIENMQERIRACKHMAQVCRNSNPRFDLERFAVACNVELKDVR